MMNSPSVQTAPVSLRKMTRLCFLAFAFVLAAVLFPGCATTNNSFPSPGADWKTFQGQLHYTSAAGKSIIGDVVIRRSPHGDFQLEFQSGPGFPLIRLWQSGEVARAEGVFARGAWQGSAAKPPQRLKSWFKLRDSFARQDHPTHLAINEGGDHFVFHFN